MAEGGIGTYEENLDKFGGFTLHSRKDFESIFKQSNTQAVNLKYILENIKVNYDITEQDNDTEQDSEINEDNNLFKVNTCTVEEYKQHRQKTSKNLKCDYEKYNRKLYNEAIKNPCKFYKDNTFTCCSSIVETKKIKDKTFAFCVKTNYNVPFFHCYIDENDKLILSDYISDAIIDEGSVFDINNLFKTHYKKIKLNTESPLASLTDLSEMITKKRIFC